MGWQIRRSKGFGPFRVTATKSGLSFSTGIPGLRVGVNTRGQVRRTFRIPGTGIYNTKLLNPKGGSSGQPRGRQRAVDGGLAAGVGQRALTADRLGACDVERHLAEEQVGERAVAVGAARPRHGGDDGLHDAGEFGIDRVVDGVEVHGAHGGDLSGWR